MATTAAAIYTAVSAGPRIERMGSSMITATGEGVVGRMLVPKRSNEAALSSPLR